MLSVGNDIVDLKEPENIGKSGEDCFLGRVFTEEERALISRSTFSDKLLWALWAAKEAAYKAVSRGDPAICSIPRSYHVVLTMGDTLKKADRLVGKVITPRGEVAIRIDANKEIVHAVAAGSESDLSRICRHVDRLDCVEDPSIFVRKKIIRAIARCIGCPARRLRIVKDTAGPGAPSVLLRGRLLTPWISFSHDGCFTAYAFVPVFEVTKGRAPLPRIDRLARFPFPRDNPHRQTEHKEEPLYRNAPAKKVY